MFRSPDPPRPARPARPTRWLPGAVAVIAVAALVASGCGGSDDDGSAGRDEGPAAAATAVDATAPTSAAGEGATTTEPASTVPASAGEGTTAPPVDAAHADDCSDTAGWGTEAREAGQMTVEDVYLVRPGRHACYDRVVFDVNGVIDGPDAVGFHVAYVEGDVQADGSGEAVPTAGGAALEVIVRAPALGYGTSGHQPGRLLGRLGDALVTTDQVAGWPALREVAFAGSFEGQTTFAVGVDRRLPFRAGAFEADGYTHVYVDIARP